MSTLIILFVGIMVFGIIVGGYKLTVGVLAYKELKENQQIEYVEVIERFKESRDHRVQ